jgi:hypothetical protein
VGDDLDLPPDTYFWDVEPPHARWGGLPPEVESPVVSRGRA